MKIIKKETKEIKVGSIIIDTEDNIEIVSELKDEEGNIKYVLVDINSGYVYLDFMTYDTLEELQTEVKENGIKTVINNYCFQWKACDFIDLNNLKTRDKIDFGSIIINTEDNNKCGIIANIGRGYSVLLNIDGNKCNVCIDLNKVYYDIDNLIIDNLQSKAILKENCIITER